ncbi:MAG: lytic murein transglycosylase B [Halieaceae bacterium]|jgi:membrane-bound lytic murein transglycosylase B|nr:lytic murein transglycosylase B [Halieaceae bacterium]MBT6334019.1 lytic murein transglycosylase B [Halieaceae bacterium]MBT7339475.1 lytic murein transglycosylase B [Halieaceae bacterium]
MTRPAHMVFWIMFGLILPTTSFGGEYSERTERDEVLANVVEQGVDRTWAAALLDQAERKQSILDAISRPAEKTKPWYDYRKIFLTDKRAREGVAFAQQNAETLAKVSDQTGVPASVITAIIGVETFYGRITGSYRVIDALATLAFDYPKRSPFFTRELQNFLVLAYESGKDPLALKGSYAGAMGYGQFMPSSYRAYAVDYDGDGVADIWTNADDAIASVANYFLRHGWQPGAPVIVPANYDGDSSEIFAGGLKPEKTVGELAEEGFAPRSATDISLVATPLRLEGSEGYEYWLCLENFYVITRYNHSAMYALSVWQLSQEIESLAAGA